MLVILETSQLEMMVIRFVSLKKFLVIVFSNVSLEKSPHPLHLAKEVRVLLH